MTSDGDPAPPTQPAQRDADVGRLAHDLANSVTSISAFAHLVRTDPRLPADLQRQAALLGAETQRLVELMDALVALARGSDAAPVSATATNALSATAPKPFAAEAKSAPSAETEPTRDPGGGASVIAAAHHGRVLVVDDEPSIREFLGRVLERSGYSVVLCASGRQAMDAVRADPPDAILCDHRMNGMDGTAFYQAVAQIAPHLGRRFVLMSGDVVNRDLRAFAAIHGTRLLGKPFDIATVTSTVASVLADEPG